MKKTIFIIAALCATSCATRNNNIERIPSNLDTASSAVMAGDWCSGLEIKEVEKGLITIRLANLELFLEQKGETQKYCNLALPFYVPKDQSLKIKSFFVGSSAEAKGPIIKWQEKRLIHYAGLHALGGIVAREYKNYDYNELYIGAAEANCGQSVLLRIDLGHWINSDKVQQNSLSVKNSNYKMSYEVSPCLKR